MHRDVATMGIGVLAQAATDSTGGRIGVAATGVVIGVLPGGYMLYRMSRKKTREASTTDLSDVRGLGWSSLSQKIAFTVGGFALTLVGLGIVALALWLPKGTTGSSHETRRSGVSLSSPWAWVLIGLAIAFCVVWVLLSRSDGRMESEDLSSIAETEQDESATRSDL